MRNVYVIAGVTIVAVALGVAVFIYVGNIATPVEQTPMKVVTTTTEPFTEIAHGVHSTITRRTNYIITSASQLTDLWKMIDAGGQPPTIDFTREDVVAVFTGKEPTAGYDIEVSRVEDSTVRNVVVTLIKPGGSCVLAQAVTNPYQLIRLPKTALPLTHTDLVHTVSCLE